MTELTAFHQELSCPNCGFLMVKCAYNMQCLHRTCLECAVEANNSTCLCCVCEQRPDKEEFPTLKYNPAKDIRRDSGYERLASLLVTREFKPPPNIPPGMWQDIWKIAIPKLCANRINRPRNYYSLLVAQMTSARAQHEPPEICDCGIPRVEGYNPGTLICPSASVGGCSRRKYIT